MTERLWFKIGEAAAAIGVSPRDIRYWENVIPEIRPRRSQGNLRYYHRDDLPKLANIVAWINEGFTVADCKELLLTGSTNRPLGLDIEEPNVRTPRIKTPKTTKTKQRAEPEAGISEGIANESTTIAHSELHAQQFEEVIDSLKKLLSRLQAPVVMPITSFPTNNSEKEFYE
jgi:DNA-binding transcriptional MerR regulator